MTSAWTHEHVSRIEQQDFPAVRLISEEQARPLLPGILLWDMWPLQLPDGSIAKVDGGSLWMALAAPDRSDPGLRHFEARIRLLHLQNSQWRDLGWALPNAEYAFEREWAGTALLKGQTVSLFFTAAGRADQPGGYQQRLFEAHGTLQPDGHIANWSEPRESVVNSGDHYDLADQQEGEPGKITAFRDPAYFCDPADGQEYLLFTASLAGSKSEYNGAVGIARRSGEDGWELLPPLLHADGVNNELERAHMVARDGRYYLFWVTQAGTFDPAGPVGPTGLYGMVSNQLFGDYEPINGSGLILANPREEPSQTYSWHVTRELLVSSFVDHWGLKGRSLANDPQLAAESFGGTPAPFVRLVLDGNRASLCRDLVNVG
ncbi:MULTISPECIES: glycoside hydrolase family 68 protein [unclassified Novosphingobium]|uniref:glycoside hydrolase family 68 protein n=1 Tax=unclassified Novosphingobium TaxID=2644732 RepID=UPI0025F5ADAB|nr:MULTISPECIES: glycoside hydrolase family 68 protein [unclassified Novosphingobium]HQV01913.1 glycoside hydrolase family 68 protein [Novosphingobium sp.]